VALLQIKRRSSNGPHRPFLQINVVFSSYKHGCEGFQWLPANSAPLISMARVSGAVIKGYEKDVGTKTSFYGFTAYSLVTSLQILGHRGFRNIPRGKVSQVDAACRHGSGGTLLVCGLQF